MTYPTFLSGYICGYLSALDDAQLALAAEARRKLDAGTCYLPGEHAVIQEALRAGCKLILLRREAIAHAIEAVEELRPREPRQKRAARKRRAA